MRDEFNHKSLGQPAHIGLLAHSTDQMGFGHDSIFVSSAETIARVAVQTVGDDQGQVESQPVAANRPRRRSLRGRVLAQILALPVILRHFAHGHELFPAGYDKAMPFSVLEGAHSSR